MIDNTEKEKKIDLKEKVKKAFSFASLAGLLIGIIGGFAYYKFVGCTSGGCAITSNPWLTMLWGALMGYLIGDMFRKKPQKENKL